MSDDPVLDALNRAADEVTPDDINKCIAYLRKHRADWAAGVKTKKVKEEVSLAALGFDLKPKITLGGRRF